MIDTHIYDYDTYSRDTEMSTYLCAESVMSDIDAYLRDRSNLALDSDMVFPRLLERNLHLAAENKVLRTVLDSYNWIDIDTKSISGANVEAVRDIVGPQVFDDFFQTDVILPKPMDPEVAVQLLSPSESVKYCARLDELYYPKAFSKLMLKSTVDTLCDLYKSRRYGFDILSSAFGNLADHIHEAKQVAEDLSYDVGAPKHFDDCIQYLKEQTEEFVLSDKARERIGGKQFDVPQKKRLDLSQFYGENKYSDGTYMELGD